MRSGPTLRRSSQPLTLWHPLQPYFSKSSRPVLREVARGTSTMPWWHLMHWASVWPLAIIG